MAYTTITNGKTRTQLQDPMASAALFDVVLTQKEFEVRPPVLIDIGASGEICADWQSIARHCVCIAFEADDREFSHVVGLESEYKELHVLNCVVTDHAAPESDFYLTRSPFCSSLLPPNNARLAHWQFWELFEVDRVTKLKSRGLSSVLNELGVTSADWVKTDSQGTDLRLFQCMGPEVYQRVLAADFEPGIIDAYHGEDKLHQLMAWMDGQPFWMSHLEIKGTARISKELMARYASRLEDLNLVNTPGWGEVSYMNDMTAPSLQNKRCALLAWVIATIRGQHAFAIEVLLKSESLIDAALFSRLISRSEAEMFAKTPPATMRDRVRNKLVRVINSVV